MPHPCSALANVFARFGTVGALALLAPACASSTRPPAEPAPSPVAEESHGAKRERTLSSTESTESAARRAKTGDDDKADPSRERGFPADELRTAMRAAADGLTSCGDSTSARLYQAALRIETSGRVSRVDVTPSEGAATSCIQARLLELSVRPFSGDSVTIMMPVKLPAR